MSLSELQSILQLTIPIAKGAGAILREGLRNMSAHQVAYKSATDPVTEYDHKSEAHIVAALRQHFPHHHIVGEEGGAYEVPSDAERSPLSTSTWQWQIDPLDGTVNFAHGYPLFSVSMGLLRDGVPVLGVVYNPMNDELFSAAQGGGAHLNGQPIRVSQNAPLTRALLNTGFPYDRRTSPDNNFDLFVRFQRASLEVRRIGSAALDCCMVACGRMDGYWEMKIKPHDISAGIIIVREAGGTVTDFDGADDIIKKQRIVASNGLIHEEMLAVIRN